MKKYLLTCVILFAAVFVFAQPAKTKPKPKEKPSQSQTANAQSCNNHDDLIGIPGSLLDHTHTPVGGHSLPAAEKKIAINVLKQVENIYKKNFSFKGGEAQSWFAIDEKEYFDLFYHSTYQYGTGFYQYFCANNKKITAHEYGTNFKITANAPFYTIALPHPPYDYDNSFFYANNLKNEWPYISVFRFIQLSPGDAAIINAGNGYIDNITGNSWGDVYRSWYVTPLGTKLLTEVTRKEFLASLLEFYDREKAFLSAENERRLTEAKKYMQVCEKNGDKKGYQRYVEDKQKYEQEIPKITTTYNRKKDKVEMLLKNNSAQWLNELAVLDPIARFCADFFSEIKYSCNGFYNSPGGLEIYKWNPTVVKQYLNNPAKPLFFKVTFRFKSGKKFSTDIHDGFVKNFDFEALRKLL